MKEIKFFRKDENTESLRLFAVARTSQEAFHLWKQKDLKLHIQIADGPILSGWEARWAIESLFQKSYNL